MQVGGALGNRVVDHQFEKPHHRRVAGRDVQLWRAQRIHAFLYVVADVRAGGVAPLDQVAYVLRRAAGDFDRPLGQPLQLVERDDIERFA